MPEAPDPKHRPHPFRLPPEALAPPRADSGGRYVELDTISNYSFLRGASHPEELVSRAAMLGMKAIGVADVHSLAGIVRAHVAAKQHGIQLVVGSRVRPSDACDLALLLYPTDRPSYGRMCRLLTLGKRRAPKGECSLTLADVADHAEGLLCIAVLPHSRLPDKADDTHLAFLRDAFDADRLSVAITRPFRCDDDDRLDAITAWATTHRVPLVATNAVLYHTHDRRPLQDVLTCIRLGVSLDAAGFNLVPNSEQHLKPPREMERLFSSHPRAIARTLDIARRAAGFNLDQIRYEYPHEVTPPGSTPIQHLRALAEEGLRTFYPHGVPEQQRATVEYELALIEELNYPAYFLTVYDIVRFARSRGILCQGRGAAANSAVCYFLGITSVDPAQTDLLFERFISKERNDPPDIDIDFEHERREEVLQYIYTKYGRDRAAMTAEVITYRPKSAVRDVGKALGLSLDCVDRLARNLEWWDTETIDAAGLARLGLDPGDRTIRLLAYLSAQILGFPRHLSQHVGGMVMTNTPLCELVPIENAAMEDRTVIEWDKDDIDAMGMLKVDCLGLGMLTCIRKCFSLVKQHHGRDLTLANIPHDDSKVYDLICAAKTIGVFQIESRAQMNMLPRLRPRRFYDLVIEVAIVRPGPIQGKMVHPYLRRRNGEEPVTYPNEAVKQVLGRTLGVPLFQEQAMKLAIVAAGFTPGEADDLRRAMAAWKRKGDAIYRLGQKMIDGMLARGYDADFADRCFEQIKGFSSYGFPESHAASFALLVYVSCWLKTHYPAAFAAALINSQPMGFYQPAQIVRDAQELGVPVRAIDVNHSTWDCTLEDGGGVLRLGMRQAESVGEGWADAIVRERLRGGSFRTLDELRRRAGVSIAALRRLARADAFTSMRLDRQKALFEIQNLRDEHLPLFDHVDDGFTDAALPFITPAQRVHQDYQATGLSLKAHPVSFMRGQLNDRGVVACGRLTDEAKFPHGKQVRVAGLVLIRQRPSTASGIVFFTIEDESGIANLVLFPKVYELYRQAARHSAAIIASGQVERNGQVVHVRVRRVERLKPTTGDVGQRSRDFH
ncbi:MAG: error-prone DNA polymerase [Phycisphaeraceae bacterium]|nr:error-prone DNA polymerase [Phycisphaerae bacterium]MBX3391098.1 error-prone DNA polymerase [Phycisphaeraceae bacterium]